MMTQTTNTNVRHEVKYAAKANHVQFSTPDRPIVAQSPRPAADDEDAQWVTQRMFDHYNG